VVGGGGGGKWEVWKVGGEVEDTWHFLEQGLVIELCHPGGKQN
jgi:hypothetical protein